MTVEASELRRIFTLLLSHIEDCGSAQFNIADDFYWDIPRPDRYNPYEEPHDLNLGQLSDDWANLQRIANGESVPIGYGLVWLSSILRAVGESHIA